MSKKPSEINPVPATRLKELINREKIQQQELADYICMSQQSISRIIQKKQSLTDHTARAIIDVFPDYRIEWLLGYDDLVTHADENRMLVNNMIGTAEAIHQVIQFVTDDICRRENIKNPDMDPLSDFLILQNQLHDYAEMIIYYYLFQRENSRIWQRLNRKPCKQDEKE